MDVFQFLLVFRLPENDNSRDEVSARLREGGCADALIGFTQEGELSLSFSRQGTKFLPAVASAFEDVNRLIPDNRFVRSEYDCNLLDNPYEPPNFHFGNGRFIGKAVTVEKWD